MRAGLTSAQVAQLAARLLEDKKARQVRILDISQISTVADYFVVGSASSTVHLRAIADHVEEQLDQVGMRKRHMEGYRNGRWILLDYGDLVIHLFHEEERDFYNLERLWGDAPVLEHTPVAALN